MNAQEAYKAIYQDRSLIGNIELESIIVTNIYYSYYYAQAVLNARFDLGEGSISMDVLYLYYYLTIVPDTFSIDLALIVLASKYKDDYVWWYLRGNN